MAKKSAQQKLIERLRLTNTILRDQAGLKLHDPVVDSQQYTRISNPLQRSGTKGSHENQIKQLTDENEQLDKIVTTKKSIKEFEQKLASMKLSLSAWGLASKEQLDAVQQQKAQLAEQIKALEHSLHEAQRQLQEARQKAEQQHSIDQLSLNEKERKLSSISEAAKSQLHEQQFLAEQLEEAHKDITHWRVLLNDANVIKKTQAEKITKLEKKLNQDELHHLMALNIAQNENAELTQKIQEISFSLSETNAELSATKQLLDAFEDTNKQLLAANNLFMLEFKKQETHIAELQAIYADMMAELEATKQQHQDIKSQLEEVKEQASQAKGRLQQLETLHTTLVSKSQQLEEKNKQLEDAIITQKEGLAQLGAEIVETNDQKARINQELDELKKSHSTLQREHEKLEVAYGLTLTEQDNLTFSNQKLSHENQNLVNEVASLNKENNGFTKELEQLQTQVTQVAMEKNEAQEAYARTTTENEKLRIDLADATDHLAASRLTNTQLQEDNTHLTNRNISLEAELAQLRAMLAEAKQQAAAAEQATAETQAVLAEVLSAQEETLATNQELQQQLTEAKGQITAEQTKNELLEVSLHDEEEYSTSLRAKFEDECDAHERTKRELIGAEIELQQLAKPSTAFSSNQDITPGNSVELNKEDALLASFVDLGATPQDTPNPDAPAIQALIASTQKGSFFPTILNSQMPGSGSNNKQGTVELNHVVTTPGSTNGR